MLDKGEIERAQRELGQFEIADVVGMLAMYREMFAAAGAMKAWQAGVSSELVYLLATKLKTVADEILAQTGNCADAVREAGDQAINPRGMTQ